MRQSFVPSSPDSLKLTGTRLRLVLDTEVVR
jgi:hypothetical protein